MAKWQGVAALMLAVSLGGPAARAQAGDSAEQRADAARQVFAAARAAARIGPVELPLAGKGRLQLPEGHAFVPQPQAAQVMNAMGNPGQDPQLQGLIFPQREDGAANWFVIVRYEDSGHVKDDDARDWKADELLESYREGTEAANAERRKMGATPIEVLGWAEPPAYDAASHRLVWAMTTREKGAQAGSGAEEQGVNHNTYVLGREGYFTLNLVTDLKDLPLYKPAAQAILAALDFDEGQRYADYRPDTDRTAEYGLAALVVGVAAKKLGLLAVAGLFIAKFAKVILVGLALVGAGAARWFKRGKAVTPASPSGDTDGTPPVA